jgi:hypothetical protein
LIKGPAGPLATGLIVHADHLYSSARNWKRPVEGKVADSTVTTGKPLGYICFFHTCAPCDFATAYLGLTVFARSRLAAGINSPQQPGKFDELLR